MKRIDLPRIGMRIVKSAIGVFLCYIVNLFRGEAGIVFYSQLAVLWCMQDYVRETKEKAKQRTIGTVIGAIWGLFVILAYQNVMHMIGEQSNILYGAIVSVVIVFVLYTTVVLKKKQASYFSCVVFLSIVVNHIADENPYLFVFNRLLDTMIGIGIGVCVNCFQLPRTKRKEILFLSGLDDTLLAPNGAMSDYSRVELNRLIEDGAQFTISTIRTPASLMEPLRGIHLKLPLIVMDGAALYNIAEKRYEFTYVISPENSMLIKEYFAQRKIPYFANVIIDDLLLIYYHDTDYVEYNQLVNMLRTSPYRNYIHRTVPDDECVVYYMVIDTFDNINNLHEELKELPFANGLKMVVQPSPEIPGCYFLKIYNHNATKENMLDYLRNQVNVEQTITFGTIEQKYDHIIQPGDFNKVVQWMKREYEPIMLQKLL